jgi:hypothetical protein
MNPIVRRASAAMKSLPSAWPTIAAGAIVVALFVLA